MAHKSKNEKNVPATAMWTVPQCAIPPKCGIYCYSRCITCFSHLVQMGRFVGLVMGVVGGWVGVVSLVLNCMCSETLRDGGLSNLIPTSFQLSLEENWNVVKNIAVQ